MTVSLPNQLVTGIQGIDDQHRALIHWARTINTLDASNGGQDTLRQASQFLIAYTRFHFESEEHAMAAAGYEGTGQHRSEHQMLRRQLAKLNELISGANYGSDITTICAMQRLIREWIQNHISASDLAFARFCERQPETRHIQLPSPQELEDSGVSVADIEMVEAVHTAGAITGEELPKRMILKIRD
jgi:hemerythrin